MDELRIANWNVEWRRPEGRDAKEIRKRLEVFDPDVVCLTESWIEMLSDWGGYTITTRPRPPRPEGKRAVLLWSRAPWKGVGDGGTISEARQSFLSATTDTPIGRVQFAGIIIPYHMADVAHGTRDQRMWDRHAAFLDHLPSAIAEMDGNSIVLGDFNQRIPSTWVPDKLQRQLLSVLEKYKIATANPMPGSTELAIDHIAVGNELAAEAGPILSNERTDGKELSDHFGVTAIVRRCAQ
jgi:exonuclease III